MTEFTTLLVAGKADLTKAEKSLAALDSSQATVKGSCGGHIREVHWSAELTGGVVLVAACAGVPHCEERPSAAHSRRDHLCCGLQGTQGFHGSHTARSGPGAAHSRRD